MNMVLPRIQQPTAGDNIKVEQLVSSNNEVFIIWYATDIIARVRREASESLVEERLTFSQASALNTKGYITKLSSLIVCENICCKCVCQSLWGLDLKQFFSLSVSVLESKKWNLYTWLMLCLNDLYESEQYTGLRMQISGLLYPRSSWDRWVRYPTSSELLKSGLNCSHRNDYQHWPRNV